MVTDASPSGWGATLELNEEEVLVALAPWNSQDRKMTSNAKELTAVY